MLNLELPTLPLLVALGTGLLIGAERERSNRERSLPAAAGIRTFSIVSVSGAVAMATGGAVVLAATAAAISLIAGLSYWRTRQDDDPGIITEISLLLTLLVGALAMVDAAAAGAVSVTITLLLAARKGVHHFVASVLSETEVHAALILAASVVVILPLLPTRPVGPFDALNLHSIWRLVVLVLTIGAIGHVAVRALGPRFGLPITGFASGFISSSATVGAMGARAAKSPAIMGAATAGAVLSTVATVIQMAAVVGATDLPTLRAMALPLLLGGIAAAVDGGIFTVMALREPYQADDEDTRKPFSLAAAIKFAAILSIVVLVSAALREWFGEAGAIVAAALAGFVDTHAAAISIAALAAAGKMTPAEAVVPILAAFTANTVTKVVLATTSGGPRFALRVIPGLILVLIAIWGGAFITHLLG